MRKYNYKSDFDFTVPLVGPDGNTVRPSAVDFIAKIHHLYGGKKFIVSHQNKTWNNCYEEDGLLHVVMNDHGLAPGKLLWDVSFYIPDSKYPDGFRTIVKNYSLA